MKRQIEIFGTIGTSCRDEETLYQMLTAGMTGIRLNLSHTTLEDSREEISAYHNAADRIIAESHLHGKTISSPAEPSSNAERKHYLSNRTADLLVDLRGPEMRICALDNPIPLTENDTAEIPIPGLLAEFFSTGQSVLIDDGALLCEVTGAPRTSAGQALLPVRVIRGGMLCGRKSIKIPDFENCLPALTAEDLTAIAAANTFGVTAVMQPFVRGAADVRAVLEAMHRADSDNLRLFVKIENRTGIDRLPEILDTLRSRGRRDDMIVIARGDLGNDMPLWELPAAQKKIEAACHKAHIPYTVVTQMLSSMITNQIPTRAEVSDVYHAVYHGASAIMATNETAVGAHPVGVISYMRRIADTI